MTSRILGKQTVYICTHSQSISPLQTGYDYVRKSFNSEPQYFGIKSIAKD